MARAKVHAEIRRLVYFGYGFTLQLSGTLSVHPPSARICLRALSVPSGPAPSKLVNFTHDVFVTGKAFSLHNLYGTYFISNHFGWSSTCPTLDISSIYLFWLWVWLKRAGESEVRSECVRYMPAMPLELAYLSCDVRRLENFSRLATLYASYIRDPDPSVQHWFAREVSQGRTFKTQACLWLSFLKHHYVAITVPLSPGRPVNFVASPPKNFPNSLRHHWKGRNLLPQYVKWKL